MTEELGNIIKTCMDHLKKYDVYVVPKMEEEQSLYRWVTLIFVSHIDQVSFSALEGSYWRQEIGSSLSKVFPYFNIDCGNVGICIVYKNDM